MSAFKGTPGPWHVPPECQEAVFAGDEPLCGVYGSDLDNGDYGYTDETRANARLIAAAPDLLVLAEQYASECGECDGKGIPEFGDNAGKPCPQCADIRAEIAKATGEGA